MPHIELRLQGDGSVPEMLEAARNGRIHETDSFIITALPHGMKSGLTSIGICIELPDKSWVFAQSSLRLFLSAADAIRAKYGDELDHVQESDSSN